MTGEIIRKREMAYAFNVWNEKDGVLEYKHLGVTTVSFMESWAQTLGVGVLEMVENNIVDNYGKVWEEFKAENEEWL